MPSTMPSAIGHPPFSAALYGVSVVACPAAENSMTPPQLHISLDELFNVGMLASRTVGAPTIHGAMVIGTHGIGVRRIFGKARSSE